MPPPFELAFRLTRAVRNFDGPARTALQSALRRPRVRVADRKTGLAFDVRRGAERMFGEVMHTRCYDVPMVPLRSGDTVVDIGANHGFYACLAASQGARVLAFEPDPESVPLLRSNVARNAMSGQVAIEAAAVSGRDGHACFGSSGTMGGGRSALTELRPVEADMSSTTVEVKSFETILREHAVDRVRLCKLDCEGAELPIFRDAPLGALRRVDAFALEFHPELYDVSELIESIERIGAFHIGRFVTVDYRSYILHLVNRDALLSWARNPS
jgi:FkbM family methyltransferase